MRRLAEAAKAPAEKPFFLYLSHRPSTPILSLPRTKTYWPPALQTPITEADTATNTGTNPAGCATAQLLHGVDFPYHSDLDIERYYKRYCETLCAVDESVGRVSSS